MRNRRDREARHAASGDAQAKRRLMLRAIGAGLLEPEVVAMAATLIGDRAGTTTDEAAIIAASQSLPDGTLRWTGADDLESMQRGYVLEFFEMIPREPGQGTSFSRIQVELAEDPATEYWTAEAQRLATTFADRTRTNVDAADAAAWWAIRMGAFAGDPHSLKALARLREESPPEYEAVLQGWNRQVADHRTGATWPAVEKRLLASLVDRILRAAKKS